MHEYSIVDNIFRIVISTAEKEGLKKITKINLCIGKMRQVVPEIMQFAFNAIAIETVASGAVLEITQVPVEITCNNCKAKSIVDDNIYICPSCGSSQLEIIRGKELFIESIEGD